MAELGGLRELAVIDLSVAFVDVYSSQVILLSHVKV